MNIIILEIFLVGIYTDLSDKRINDIIEIKEICLRNNKLIFNTSKDVEKELERIIGKYSETMNMYKIIKDYTEKARKDAKVLVQKVNNVDEIIKLNPHTCVYRILDVIDYFNKI